MAFSLKPDDFNLDQFSSMNEENGDSNWPIFIHFLFFSHSTLKCGTELTMGTPQLRLSFLNNTHGEIRQLRLNLKLCKAKHLV